MDFDVAVFTNVLKDKVEEMGGIDAYLQAQAALFSKLQDPERQRLVVNIDGMSQALACCKLCCCAPVPQSRGVLCSVALQVAFAVNHAMQKKELQASSIGANADATGHASS